ncbi:MAG: 30S ribosomal protein S20 [Deltaproteobacteria bacterium]|nr:30S ribosomal protein S20 [Deltaproteobacteria bacterium]MBW1847202.1 30S ribosomal protein S20 [Deltaproteobacteria bacterium]
MANHKSALKRARQNEIRRIRNKSVKTRVKNIIKDLKLAIDGKSKEAVPEKLNAAKSAVDKAAKKGVIHRRTAARKISRLSRLANPDSA